MEPGSQLIIEVAGEDLKGKAYNKTVMLKVGDEGTGKERLDTIGLETRNQADKILIDNVVFSSAAEKAGIDFDQEILNIKVPTHRLPKQLMFIPALGLLALIWYLQRNRKRKLEAAVA
jgi:predicted metalloprotease with PDZ domain